MISRRNFFSITIMMFILVILFQFTVILKDRYNTYDANSSFTEKTVDGENVWKQESTEIKTLSAQGESYVLFVGEKAGEMQTAVKQWCTYTKRNLLEYENFTEELLKKEINPELIIFEDESQLKSETLKCLKEYVSDGNIVIVGSLEDPKNIRDDKELQQFLGISEVVATKTEIIGVKVFEGLLLGGEIVYLPMTEEEKQEEMDFEDEVAWYQTASGTKTYMVGLMEDEEVANEELPALLWRNGTLGGSVYAVCGDYMKDVTAIGLLSGMVTESSEYTIYPIVNAQNISIINFPGFADENSEKMMELYSRPITSIAQDIIWPDLISIMEQSDHKMTCYIQPQADYTDEIEPEREDFTFFLKQIKEQNGEVGISMGYRKASSMKDKLEKDAAFLQETETAYEYGTAYVESKDLEMILEEKDHSLLKQISSFVCEYQENEELLSYCTDDITLQMITNDGGNYTYRDDLRMRSIQTALGYTNISMDLQNIFWPKDSNDNWLKVQKTFAENITTYWKKFDYFQETTISESNRHVRAFLNLDYSYEDFENETILRTTEKDTWFLLRTHNVEISEIVGGSYVELEDDVYLIYADTETVRIVFEKPSLHYHVG